MGSYFTMNALPDKDYKKMYRIAENFFLNENYSNALPYYLKLDSVNKGNANLNFKIGYCYMNSGSTKTLSIPYFLEATKNVSDHYIEYSVKEVRAPFSTYSYLARAYQLDYKFDDAIAAFEKYKSLIYQDANNAEEINDIDHEIEICKNAKEFTTSPAKYTINNLGEGVNSKYSDYSPVLSLDEKTLIFTSRRPGSTGEKKETNGQFYEDIYVSQFENEKWGNAKQIGTNINTSENEATVNLSADGQNLLIYRDDKGDGNLYVSEKQGAAWSLPKSLGVNINTSSWETHACFSSDNNMLFFVSNKSGGLGGRDIYKCLRLPNGEWGPAQNLGNTINTKYDEDGVFIHPNGKEIFFSSKGHNTMGGFDVFSSKMDDENGFWSKPVNMGSPINSPDDDIFFVVSADGKRGYFSSDKKGGFGEKDIYMIDFRENMPEALTLLKGFVTLNGAAPSGGLANVEITATDVASNTLVQNVKPILSTGKYIMLLSSGLKGKTYKINCTAEGFQPVSFLMTVPPDSSYQEIERSMKLQFINFESDKFISKDLLKGEESLSMISPPPSLEKGAITERVSIVEKTLKGENAKGIVAAKVDSLSLVKNEFKKQSEIKLGYFLFDTNKHRYQKEFNDEFDELLKVMLEHSDLIIEVQGHTDSIGKKEYNLKLSKQRANTVVKQLIKNGINKNQLISVGYGSEFPAVPNTFSNGEPNLEGMRLNRRVALKVVHLGK